MAVQHGVWGIDLGQCALKALRLETQEGQVTATAFDYVEHPKILSQPDADPDQLTREALEKFLSRNSLKGDVVAISVPGQSGLARFVKLPPVEEKKISDIVKFEAKQQIPFNLDEVVWDYQKVSSGVVTDGFALETEIGLFAMKRDMVNRYLQHFKDVNVEVHIVQMAPLCLCNYVAYDLLNVGAGAEGGEAAAGKKHCVVALDIGADASNLVVTDGQRIIWQRPIPLGGNHFTRALTKDLKLTFAKAEHLKRNATKSGPELKKILTALKPVLNDFAGEVQRSLGYFTNTHRDAQVEYMVGLGSAFRLPGLQRFLAEKLGLEVRKLQKLERLAGEAVIGAPAFTENVLSFAVAYGLALQAVKAARLQTNLLPPEIRTARLVRGKKPWAAAAAAALLLGTGGLAWSYALEYRSVDTEHSPLKGAVDEADAVAKLVGSKNDEFKKQKDATDNEEKAVKGIIAGQDEKLNWINLNQFIASALPRPNGDNLSHERWSADDRKSPYERYWTNNARKAYDKYRDLLARPPKPGSQLDTSEIDADLIQFNIEAVDARFSDDLSAYWAKVKTNLLQIGDEKDQKLKVRPLSHWENGPKEKESGWVVELRGYTYNRAGARFVIEGLVPALAEKAGLRDAATVPAGGSPAAGATPAVGAAPAAGDAAKPDLKDPIVGRVSHVVLVRVDDKGSDLINNSVVATLVGGGAGALQPGGGLGLKMPGLPGGPGGPGGLGGLAGGGGRDGWKPLLGSAGSGGGMPPGVTPPRPGGTGERYQPYGPSGPGGTGDTRPGGGTPPAPGDAGTKPPPGEKPAAAPLGRTEFVVLFIWKENTPSDALRPTTVIATPEPAAGSGGPGMPGMPGGMAGASGGAAPPSSPPSDPPSSGIRLPRD